MAKIWFDFCFVVFIVFISFQVLYIFFPLFTVRGHHQFQKPITEKSMTILVPAFNEEKIIHHCLQGIVNLNYSNYEAIIINDGSSDKTLQKLYNYLQLHKVNKSPANHIPHEHILGYYQSTLYPKIFIIDKKNGGKADALNAGIEYASHDIVITLDADSVLDPHALAAMNQAFDDDKVLAAGGMVQIAQGFNGDFTKPKPVFTLSNLIRYQIIQYITDFYLYKTTQAKLSSITVIAGAFGTFKRAALFEVGGFRKTVGEDMDITLRMQMLLKNNYKKHKLIFVPQAICYTECPSTFKSLLSQRLRWQKGFIDCVVNFRKHFFTKLSVPVSIYLLVDSLFLGTIMAFPTMLIPIMILIKQNIGMALFFLSITSLIGFYRSLTSIIIKQRYGHIYSKKDYLKFISFIPLEVLVFRLLGLVFVTVGTILYIINKNSWNVVERVGINNQSYRGGILINRKQLVHQEEFSEKKLV